MKKDTVNILEVAMWEVGYLVVCCLTSFLIGCGFATRHWRNRNTKEGTPFASHNRQSNVIMPHCKTCSGFDKTSLARCYGCKGSKWAPA